jgi:MFS family permease
MNDRPELVTQVPEGFRPVKRWRIAFKVWGITTIVVSVIGTLSVLLIEFIFDRFLHYHHQHRGWQIALAVFAVCGIGILPLFVNVVRSYPSRRRWS